MSPRIVLVCADCGARDGSCPCHAPTATAESRLTQAHQAGLVVVLVDGRLVAAPDPREPAVEAERLATWAQVGL